MPSVLKPRKQVLLLDLSNPSFLHTNSTQANYLAVVAWVEYQAMPYHQRYFGIDEWLEQTLEAHSVMLAVDDTATLLNTALEAYYEFDRLMVKYIEHSIHDVSYLHLTEDTTVITIIYYGA